MNQYIYIQEKVKNMRMQHEKKKKLQIHDIQAFPVVLAILSDGEPCETI